MNNIIQDIKNRIYYNPKKTAVILENISKTNNIKKQELIKQFIEQESVHPAVYASLIDEAIDEVNEGIGDFVKDKLGALKDKALSKVTFGGTKQRVAGRQENRARMNDLFIGWNKFAGRTKAEPTEDNLKKFLAASGFNTKVGEEAVKFFQTMFAQTESITEGILPAGKLRDFFTKVAELELEIGVDTASAQTIRKQQKADRKITNIAGKDLTPEQLADLVAHVGKLPDALQAQINAVALSKMDAIQITKISGY